MSASACVVVVVVSGQLLDLSYNRLCDVSSVEMLSTCPQLHTLHLYNNPVWTLGSAVYRRLVASSIPQVALLDGKRVTAEERTPMVRTRARIGCHALCHTPAHSLSLSHPPLCALVIRMRAWWPRRWRR